MDFPKKQAQRLMPLYLLEYSEKLFTNHPNPEDPWGGGNYTAGQGITITNDVISVDDTIAKKSEIPTNYVTTDTEQTITGLKTIGQTSGTLSEVDFSGFTFKLVNKAINSTEAEIKISNSSYDGNQHPHIYSTKGLYVNLAKIRLGDDGSNTYGIKMPDSSTWESDRVLATTADIPSLPVLATVATSGSYNDLTDKPYIIPSNRIVTTDEIQTISGVKTFEGSIGLVDATRATKTAILPYRFDYTSIDPVTRTKSRTLFNLPTSKPKGTEDAPTEYTLATTDDIPSLTGYATEQWVQDQGYATSSEMSNHPFYRVNDGNAYMLFDWDGTDPFYKVYELNQPARVRLNALNPNYGAGLSATYNPETLALDISLDENAIPSIIPNVPLSPVQTLSTLQVNGVVYGIPESKTYISGTGIDITNDTISIDNTVALKTEIPNTATSTSTSTVTPTTIELVFTYEDNTTQTITLMTGATVSTSTTTTLS